MADEKTLKTVVIIMAMEAEASPFIEHMKLELRSDVFPEHFPGQCYSGEHLGKKIHLVLNGKDKTFGVDIVGTVGGGVTTYAAIQALSPDLIINAGTCGGFKAMNGKIGSIYLCSTFVNHDRRIPIPGFDKFGVGKMQTVEIHKELFEEVGAEDGIVSSGNSLDMCKEDEGYLKENKATCKDMEGAAIAYIAHTLKVPMFALKSVTDLVDGGKPTQEEFLENLHTAAASLQDALPKVLTCIASKPLPTLK